MARDSGNLAVTRHIYTSVSLGRLDPHAVRPAAPRGGCGPDRIGGSVAAEGPHRAGVAAAGRRTAARVELDLYRFSMANRVPVPDKARSHMPC